MPMRVRVSAVFSRLAVPLALAVTPLGMAAIVSTPGCFGSGGPSAVGQGKQYSSGNPQFDEFFTVLYELQIELSKAPDSEKEIRQELAKKLKGDPDASASLLSKRIEKRAKELASAGTGLKVEISGMESGEDAAAEIKAAGKDLDSDGKAFTEAVEKATKAELKLLVKMRKAKLEIDRLKSLAFALEPQIDAAFRKSVAKRSEVRKNLEDAKTLLPIMAARTDEVMELARSAARKFADAAQTDDGSFDKPPPPPPPEEPAEEANGDKPKGDKPKPKGDKPAGKPAGKPSEPTNKPAPPPPPPSDFEP